MKAETLAPARASCDESIRAWTAWEDEILLAYRGGDLELPHPPNFIKEMLVNEHRAMMEDMHEEHFNVTLTTVLPATMQLAAKAPHAELFKELVLANTDKRTGHSMLRALQRDVKRLSFDGFHTLQFVFYSESAATRWLLKALRFQKAVIVFQDTTRGVEEEGTGQYSAAQLDLNILTGCTGEKR
ncbi:hypothetical protein PC129_g20075 [Phytophthora cactorum]|uniref:Uncharacterized protein n=2 Tax=Phytophthora cactorum TaxID=29920 RepID=A0A329SAQ9_9STRA|nr:hypothetical protein GQ600_8587 [Phytophthora cactorum]KAG2784552.1 hypothetical protein Pcac1_g5743 [Phytophthora cactorum]KAG2830168.1 hypothetical protein PC112_g7810 [Phytophthora cactorum]KAG2877300.1 hypothetical protein PC114_g23718 [Phytophthora cactorum]KAG2894126.1 hypothetical protein PC117_g23559 [Phytophthora cactorum]